MRKVQPISERFWSKVDASGECWEWLAGKDIHGYGKFGPRPGTSVGAHRMAYYLMVGDIPEGMQLDHLCRNRACVNPAHLEPVSPRTNYLRGVGPVAVNHAKEVCDSGHPFTVENTYIRPNGNRMCRECHRAANREFARRKSASVR